MRYLILVLLNLPIILIALVNIVTQYKLGKVSKRRFKSQMFLWLVLLILLICSFPIYNLSIGKPLLDSSELSSFDMVEVTALVALFYVVNNHRRKIEENERLIRDLHQELSIKLSRSND